MNSGWRLAYRPTLTPIRYPLNAIRSSCRSLTFRLLYEILWSCGLGLRPGAKDSNVVEIEDDIEQTD